MLTRLAVLFTMLAVISGAQTRKPAKLPEISHDPHTTYRRWGKLYNIKIPRSCQHPKQVPLFPVAGIEQKKTCGVFVSFSGVIQRGTPYERLAYRTWDEAETRPDHVYLKVTKEQAWRGVTVYGPPGHKVMLEVTYQ